MVWKGRFVASYGFLLSNVSCSAILLGSKSERLVPRGRRDVEHEARPVPVTPVVEHRVRLAQETRLQRLGVGDRPQRGGTEPIGEGPVGALNAAIDRHGGRRGRRPGALRILRLHCAGGQQQCRGQCSECSCRCRHATAVASMNRHVLHPPVSESRDRPRAWTRHRRALYRLSPQIYSPETLRAGRPRRNRRHTGPPFSSYALIARIGARC